MNRIAIGVLAAVAGCAGPVHVDLRGSAPTTAESLPRAAGEPQDYSDWGLTLSRAVRDGGVDYERLAADPRPLNRFLAGLAARGPASTPDAFATREARLSYAINAYNAAAVRSVVALCRDGKPPFRVPGDLDRRFSFDIDGSRRTPGDLRADALRLAGADWRVRFALCDGRRSGPRLQRRPFLSEMLDAQLDLAVRDALGSAEVVRIDHGWQILYVWRGLFDLRHQLVRDYERRLATRGATLLNVLLDRADRPLREVLNTAIGYEVREMPSDDALNTVAHSQSDRRLPAS